ncbi:type II secretion system F family protein [Patescibacteria group bacterium]|nr:type II secretion system F family protein [Patescibacteria group bacterium]MBU4512478.1 type II secretion system F family protein [Patescibacteria group bacterium]MCG2692607.1 type II secretion system F family protein [Candidatus Parcubacteria bacterium]
MDNKTNKTTETAWKKKLIDTFVRFQGVPLSQKLFFTKNLQVMIKAGIPLSTALNILARQTPNEKFKRIIFAVHKKVEKGDSLAKSLSEYPKIFSEVFVNMISAGEKSGSLENILGQLTLQMKKTHELLARIKSALAYPAFVILAMVGMGVLMLIFVIPKIIDIFAEINATLPLPTRILIFVSNFIVKNGVWVILGAVVLLVFTIKFLRSKRGQKYFHKALLATPILSPIIKKINLAKFSRTFSSLLATDIPIVQTLQITGRVLGNTSYQEYVIHVAEEIKSGESVAKVLSQKPALFPPVVTQMVEVGEKTGSLDNILKDLAEFYEEDVNQTMSGLSSIIEPVLILVLGVAVAGMAVAVIMPMYSLSQQI